MNGNAASVADGMAGARQMDAAWWNAYGDDATTTAMLAAHEADCTASAMRSAMENARDDGQPMDGQRDIRVGMAYLSDETQPCYCPSRTDGPMLTLDALEQSARSMGLSAEVLHTGGGVMALGITVDGQTYLVALDDGQQSGTEWVVATDGPTREALGELESGPMPVTSDADQTIADAVEWVRWVAAGGDVGGPLQHGERVTHHGGNYVGTVVGEPYVNRHGDYTVGVVWDGEDDMVDPNHISYVRR